VCRNAADLRAAFPAILSTKDIFDGHNEHVLVQSFLTGTEYIVDTVSVDGHAYVCGVWQYDKRLLANGKPIYNRDILIDATTRWSRNWSTTPGRCWTPSASTMDPRTPRSSSDRMGRRWSRSAPDSTATCSRPSTTCASAPTRADLTALAFVRPEEFLATRGDGVYQEQQPAIVFNTPTELSGRITAIDEALVAEIRGLPSGCST